MTGATSMFQDQGADPERKGKGREKRNRRGSEVDEWTGRSRDEQVEQIHRPTRSK